ncbi:MAG: hypothetical protein H8E73_04810 [Planctomycetes bacterium]|nr:hypothetical protein [Planctomycetota bacterium]
MALGDDKADTYVLRSPGVVFAMFMASITIIGFSHTVKKIIESNYLITNYQLLLHTARNMISEATKEEYARIRMICVTPCHGNYSERRTKAYTKYLDQITAISERTANNAYFDLICYDAADWSTDEANKSPLQKFYEQYEESDLRTAAFEEAEGFLADLESQRGKDEKQQINRRRHTHDMTLAQERAHLPSYRLLLTTNAAICYFPVDMSIKSLPADNTQHHEQIRRVEMLGFTTRVGYIVDWLELHFEHIKHEVGLEDQSQ